MEGWRGYFAMFAVAAIAGVIVAVVLSGGPRQRRDVASNPTSSAAIQTTPSASLPTRASGVAATAPSLRPTASPATLTAALKPLVATRIVSGTTLLVARSAGDSTILTAVPVAAGPTSGASAIPLVTFGRGRGWDARADAQVLAVAIETASNSARIATWNLRSGAIEWLTPDVPGVSHGTPIWSADGSLLYYASQASTTDLGIWRIRADGTGNTLVRRPDGKATGVDLVGLTPDGTGLVFSYGRSGGSADVLDLPSGTDRAYDDTAAASIAAWRATRPRALVLVGGGAGQPAPTLVLWDEIAGTKKTLLGATVPGSPTGVYGADFDATGTRVAVAVYNKIDGGEALSAIHTMDANGGGRGPVAGTEGALSVLWFRAGIVYTKRNVAGGTDILLVQPTGGAPVILYSDPGQLGKLTFVSP